MAEPRIVRETPHALTAEQIAAILPHRYPFALAAQPPLPPAEGKPL